MKAKSGRRRGILIASSTFVIAALVLAGILTYLDRGYVAPEREPDATAATGLPTSDPTSSDDATKKKAKKARDKKAKEEEDAALAKTGDGTKHQVVLSFSSDGTLYAAWKYRQEDGTVAQSRQVANKSYVINRTMQGPLPLAITFVQVLNGATFATCSISVDGKTVSTQTARGLYDVVMCY